jgi:uncharacterized protein (DUF2252 family)
MNPKEVRKEVPRSGHGDWNPHPDRPSVVEFMQRSSEGRIPDLIPVRYYRMSASPFTFLRGSPNIMAYDLAQTTPTTGHRVQACGDAHLQNFGIFGTAERNLIFDINDFDETLPAPWEWDLKRLAASVQVAGRANTFPDKRSTEAVLAAVHAYRTNMRRFAGMTALQVWYTRIDASVISDLHDAELARRVAADEKPSLANRAHRLVADEYASFKNGTAYIPDRPPKLFHPTFPSETISEVKPVIERYIASIRDDIAVLIGRYHLADWALKVVGVGSVGTRCAVVLLAAGENDGLVLQMKEAVASSLEAYAGASSYSEHGQRVVSGQRLMQSASDIFLGWTRADDGHQYYVRQLNDLKVSIDVTKLSAPDLTRYAALCGEALALAHARSGDSKAIAGYMGGATTFDEAIAQFALHYADQTERDYEAFMAAIQAKQLPTHEG